MYILGVNSAYHESAAALIHDGEIVAAAEEERFNRIKHAKRAKVDNAHELPWQAIQFCLQSARIQYTDVDHIGYSLDPRIRLLRNMELPDTVRIAAGEFGSPEGEQAFFASNQQAKKSLLQRFTRAEFHFLEHHLCHAASAFFLSPFEEAAVLAVDGIGEFNSTWLGVGRGNKIQALGHLPYPHSLGFLWEKMSEFLGFDAYSGPGKVMGYGAITDPMGELSGKDHLSSMKEVISLESDGTFRLDNDILRFRTPDFSQLERRFGPCRVCPVDRYEDASIAAALQQITEEALNHLASGLYDRLRKEKDKEQSPIVDLCLAGGVALNCVANDKLLRETPFENLWIQPAANDAGTALGAAAYLHCQVLTLGGRPRMKHAFLGPEYDDARLAEAIHQAGFACVLADDIALNVAQRLDRGEIVAWFQGAQEHGPRALGHRSILADPTRFDTRTRINSQVKLRESFRPFAPSVAADVTDDFFDLPPGALCADYMLTASPLLDDRYSQVIPAVVQENGSIHRSTSRLHRVQEEMDPLYHRMIQAFRELSGVGAVLNTSFNINEPIVTTPEQGIQTFLRSQMDCLAMGPFIVEKEK